MAAFPRPDGPEPSPELAFLYQLIGELAMCSNPGLVARAEGLRALLAAVDPLGEVAASARLELVMISLLLQDRLDPILPNGP